MSSVKKSYEYSRDVTEQLIRKGLVKRRDAKKVIETLFTFLDENYWIC